MFPALLSPCYPLAHFSHRSPIVLPSFSHLKWENDGRTMGERWEK
ncbi:MAG: hypothetical protein ACSW8I_02135 [bacterium]